MPKKNLTLDNTFVIQEVAANITTSEAKDQPVNREAAYEPDVTSVNESAAQWFWRGATKPGTVFQRSDSGERIEVAPEPYKFVRSANAFPFGNRNHWLYESWDKHGNFLIRLYLPKIKDFIDEYNGRQVSYDLERNVTYRLEFQYDPNTIVLTCYQNLTRRYKSGKGWRESLKVWDRTLPEAFVYDEEASAYGVNDEVSIMVTGLITYDAGQRLSNVEAEKVPVATAPTVRCICVPSDDVLTAACHALFQRHGKEHPTA